MNNQPLEEQLQPDAQSQENENLLSAGFVLFGTEQVDENQIAQNLKNMWGIEPSEIAGDSVMSFEYNGMTAILMFMPLPVPYSEAEENAARNYFWNEGAQVVAGHKTHMVVTVLGGDNIIEHKCFFTKLVSAVLAVDGAIGIYQNPTVLEKDYYISIASDMNEGQLPIPLWIYVNLLDEGQGFCAITDGMETFGSHELELLNTPLALGDLYEFTINIAHYIISTGTQLQHGETLGSSEEEKLPIVISPSNYFEGDSIKIVF